MQRVNLTCCRWSHDCPKHPDEEDDADVTPQVSCAENDDHGRQEQRPSAAVEEAVGNTEHVVGRGSGAKDWDHATEAHARETNRLEDRTDGEA